MADTEALELESPLLSICSLQGLCGLAIPWEPLARARLALTPVDAKDCRVKNPHGFLAAQEGPLAVVLLVKVLYLLQPPDLS